MTEIVPLSWLGLSGVFEHPGQLATRMRQPKINNNNLCAREQPAQPQEELDFSTAVNLPASLAHSSFTKSSVR